MRGTWERKSDLAGEENGREGTRARERERETERREKGEMGGDNYLFPISIFQIIQFLCLFEFWTIPPHKHYLENGQECAHITPCFDFLNSRRMYLVFH